LPLPGAADALAAVRALGGRTLVVTGKFRPNAARHLAALGWEVDWLVGELWAGGKAAALREHAATIYVGDHIGDMIGAVAAGVTAVGVTTGSCAEDQLREAGAEVVLPALTAPPGFPDQADQRERETERDTGPGRAVQPQREIVPAQHEQHEDRRERDQPEREDRDRDRHQDWPAGGWCHADSVTLVGAWLGTHGARPIRGSCD
jgi:hypothetical protein